MFGTVLRDVYRAHEKAALRAALDDLCSPTDDILWSSTGLYAYFDPYHREAESQHSQLLYVGLASDIADRFARHNGLQGRGTRGSKRKQIDEWFQGHEFLGVAILPQSPLAQIDTYRERAALSRTLKRPKKMLTSNPGDGQTSIELLEGQLIEAHRRRTGTKPPWNDIGGSVAGQAQAEHGTAAQLLSMIDGRVDSLMCARWPIRCLSRNPSYGFFESDILHTARMNAIASTSLGATDASIAEQLQQLETSTLYYGIRSQIRHMLSVGYLQESPITEPFDVIQWSTQAAC
jgi:hypothetical protein